jgi:hypothetical protein
MSQQARSMSGSQADQLRRTLEQRRQQLSNSFDQNQNSGSRQSQRGQGQRGQGQRQGQGQGQGQGQQGQGQGQGQGEGPAKGLDPTSPEHLSHQVDPSAGHGPGGDTPLVFGKDAEMDPERLKFEALPKGNGGEAEELYGLKAANPRVGRQPLNAGMTGGAAGGEQAPGAGEAPMLPKNRALIQKYFDTK